MGGIPWRLHGVLGMLIVVVAVQIVGFANFMEWDVPNEVVAVVAALAGYVLGVVTIPWWIDVSPKPRATRAPRTPRARAAAPVPVSLPTASPPASQPASDSVPAQKKRGGRPRAITPGTD